MAPSTDLLEHAISAAGGIERWDAASAAEVTLASGGRAFDMRWKRGALREVRGTLSTKDPQTIYEPYPAPGRRGVFEGDRVRIETTSGELVEERGAARSHFRGRPGLRRKLWWDHLDLLYFAGYALWNYMAAPFASPALASR